MIFYGINYNGVKPRPTHEEFINFVDDLVKLFDRSATFATDSPLLTQLDGMCTMELEALERREIVEIHKIRYDETKRNGYRHLCTDGESMQ